jgi:hypothetical protein
MSLSNKQLLALLGHNTDLGHAKRDDCFLRQVTLALETQGAPLPQLAGKGASAMASLVSLYRFVDNDGVSLDEMRRIRARTVVDAFPPGRDMVVVHDMSLLDFSRQNAKTDRRLIGDYRGMGYEYVCCAAVDPHTSRLVGVLHDTVVNTDGPDDTHAMDYDYEPLFNDLDKTEKKRLRENHRHQMAVHVNYLAELVPHQRLIHVADREFDDIFLLDRAGQVNAEFVVRAMGNRNIQLPRQDWLPADAVTRKQSGHPLKEGWCCANLSRLIPALPLQPYKDLPLDQRGRVTDLSRVARTAHLAIGVCPVCLYRRAKRNKQYFSTPHPVELNMVVIREPEPPQDVKPLCWILFTSLPVNTQEELHYVGRLYELRWKIEDFFKLLKTGYRIEQHRFDSATKTARLLVILSLAAMTLFKLKEELGLPSGGYLDPESYRRLKEATRQLHNPDIDLRWRLLAFIAKSGGWLARATDPLGPIILMRGLLQVAAILDALVRHGPLWKEVLENPELLKKLTCV